MEEKQAYLKRVSLLVKKTHKQQKIRDQSWLNHHDSQSHLSTENLLQAQNPCLPSCVDEPLL